MVKSCLGMGLDEVGTGGATCCAFFAACEAPALPLATVEDAPGRVVGLVLTDVEALGAGLYVLLERKRALRAGRSC